MSRILFALVALVAVALAVIIILPGLIPVAAYKGRIEAAASDALGRDVSIGDDLSIRFIPRVAFRVHDLVIANAEGFSDPYLARVEQAEIGVRLMPLLSKSVEIDRFVLTRPDIRLARAKSGAVNWNIAAQSAPGDTADQSAGGEPRDLKLGDVRIVDGAAQYADAAAGKTYSAKNIDMIVVLKGLAEPLEANGTMTFQGQPSKVDLVLTSLQSMLDKEPANLKLDLTVGEMVAGADLKIDTKTAMRYAGPVSFTAPDLPAAAALAGTELADAPGFDRLSLRGDLDGGETALRLSNAAVSFDDIDAQGTLDLSWSGARPKASGVLSTDKLDLRPYMPPPSQSAEGFPAWSDAKMDFSSLNNIDADFDISTGAIFVNDLEFGESRIKMTINGGRLTAEIPELAMYGGQGSGRMVVNARGAVPSFAGNFDVGSVRAQPLSKDLLKHDNLLGLGSFKLNFTATGASQAAIMNSIDGSGGFDLADGALKGLNIAAMVRAASEFTQGFNVASLQRAVAEARGPTQQTDFSEFLSQFTIADGLVSAPTITLNGPYLTMSGAGTVNLGQQTIDLRLSPRASTSIDGKEGRSAAIPIRIGGTFAKPTIGIDAESLARSGVQRTLENVLSKGSKKEGEEGAETKEDPAAAILKGVLGGGDGETGQEGDQNLEKTLINEGLNAIFKKKPAPAKTDNAEEDEKQPEKAE